MTHRKKRKAMGLLNTWNRPQKEDRAPIEEEIPDPEPVFTPAQEVKPPILTKKQSSIPPRRTRRYLNVVIDQDLESRIARSVERHQRQYGKAFGKSAWGRLAFLAKLEDEGG